MNKRTAREIGHVGNRVLSLILVVFLATGMIPALAFGGVNELDGAILLDQKDLDPSLDPDEDLDAVLAEPDEEEPADDLAGQLEVNPLSLTLSVLDEELAGAELSVLEYEPSSGVEITTLANEDISINAWISDGAETVLTGDARHVTYAFSGREVDGVVIAIPLDSMISLEVVSFIANQREVDSYTVSPSEAAVLGIPAGNYLLVAIPFTNSTGTTSGTVIVNATCFAGGTSPAGLVAYNDGYVLQGVSVSSGSGIGGGTIAFAGGAATATPCRVATDGSGKPTTKFVSDTNEELSITKTGPDSFDNLVSRSYEDVVAEQNGTPDYHKVNYTITVNSTANAAGADPRFGRINLSDIVISDQLTGFPTGSIASIIIKDSGGNVVFDSTSAGLAEGAISFSPSQTAPFVDERYTVEVSFMKLPFTKLLDGSNGVTGLTTVANAATLTYTLVTQSVATTVSDNWTYAFGYVQLVPGAVNLTVQKRVDAGGTGSFTNYTSTLQGQYGIGGPIPAPVTFTLVNDADPSDIQTLSVDGNGRVSFLNLIEGNTYTLTETQGVNVGWTTIDPVQFTVALNLLGVAEIKIVGASTNTNYATTNFNADNVNTLVGIITVDVKQQLPNTTSVQERPYVGVEVELYEVTPSGPVQVGASKLTNEAGLAVFSGLDVNKTYFAVAVTNRPYYDTPDPSDPATDFTSGNSQTINLLYTSNGGSFFLGKTFVDALGNTIPVATFKVTFALFDAADQQVGTDIIVTNTQEFIAVPVQQMLPAGTYTLKELTIENVFASGENISSQFAPGSYTVTIVANQYDARVVGTSAADPRIVNVSTLGELRIESYDYAGGFLAGIDYDVLDASNNVVASGTIPASGYASHFLPAGTYSVVTKNLPSKYVQVAGVGLDSVTISESTAAVSGIIAGTNSLTADASNNQTVAFMHAVLPTITANKVDANSGAAVYGAAFVLYRYDSGTGLYSYTGRTTSSNSSDNISFYYLEPGTYAIVEYAAATGYLEPDYSSYFYDGTSFNDPVDLAGTSVAAPTLVTVSTLDYGTTSQTVSAADIVNVRNAQVQITMGSTESPTEYSNAVFDLYRAGESTVIATASPSDSDWVTFGGGSLELAAGNYVIKQHSVNDAYILRGDEVTFTVNADGTITVPNDAVEATFLEYQYSSYTSPNDYALQIHYTNLKKIPIQQFTKLGETATYEAGTNDRDTQPLPGATFILSYNDGGTRYVLLDAAGNMVSSSTNRTDATKIISGHDGEFSIGWLDPAFAPYILEEIEVAGSSYTFKLESYSLDMTLLGSDGNIWTGSDGGLIYKVKYIYDIDNTDGFTLTNHIEMYQIDLTKFLLEKTQDGWENTAFTNWSFMYFYGSEFRIYSASASTGYDTLEDTMVLGTADMATFARTLSKELAPGTYLVLEYQPPRGSQNYEGITQNVIDAIANGEWGPGYGFYRLVGSEWVVVDPSEVAVGDTDVKVGLIVELGSPSASITPDGRQEVSFSNERRPLDGGRENWYSRIFVEKDGYLLDQNGDATLIGPISGVVFDIYLAWKPAGENAIALSPTPVQSRTTGTVSSPLSDRYGQFLTSYIFVPELMDLAEAAADAAGVSDYEIGYIVVERTGTLPFGYTAQSTQYFYLIDVSPSGPFISGQVVFETNGEGSTTSILNADPYYINNYKGEGRLRITKTSLTNASTTNGNNVATFEIYSASSLTSTDINPTGEFITTSATGSVDSAWLPAGIYYLKEITSSANHYAYGTYSGGGFSSKPFDEGDFLGPFVVQGGSTVSITVNDRRMPSLTLANRWAGEENTALAATYQVSYSGTASDSQLGNGFSSGLLTATVDTDRVLSNLPDGTYNILETGVSSPDFNVNNTASTSPGITVVISGGVITSIKSTDGDVPDTPGDDVWRTAAAATTAPTIYVNHTAKGSLVINMGYIDAYGSWIDSVPAGFTTSFTIQRSNGTDWVDVGIYPVGTTLEITLATGDYRITQNLDDLSAGYDGDDWTVYFNIGSTSRVYLRNVNNTFVKGAPTGNGSEDNPLTSGNSGGVVFFYNKLIKGELAVYKEGENSSGPLLNASFAVYTKVGTDYVLVSDAIFSYLNGAYRTMLAPGTYYIKELVAPAGYVLNEDYHEVVVAANTAADITANPMVNAVTIKDALPTSFTIRKITEYPDNTIGTIAGVQLHLYKLVDPDGATVDSQYAEIRTSQTFYTASLSDASHGTYLFVDIEPGTYKVVEALPTDGSMNYLSLSTIYGSLEDTPEIVVTHDTSGTNNTLVVGCDDIGWASDIKTLTMFNEYNGARIVVEKFDFTSGNAIDDLTGFTFELYRTEFGAQTRNTSDLVATASGSPASNGTIILADIATEELTLPASYFIREAAAPSGYVLNEVYGPLVQEVIIDSGNAIYSTRFDNFLQTGTTALGITKTVEARSESDAETVTSPSKPLSEESISAAYTLAQQAPNNPTPLTNYTVSDAGIVFSGDSGVVTGPSYTLDQATIYPASYTDVNGMVHDVNAVQVNGTWHALSSNAAIPTVVDLGGAQTVTIVYSTEEPAAGEDAVVGPNFVPGDIILDATYMRYVQNPNLAAEPLTEEVTKIVNTVTVSAEGQTLAQDSSTITSNPAEISIPAVELSQLKVEKEQLTTPPVFNGDTIDYRLTLTNTSAAVPLVAPVLIDEMSGGAAFKDLISITGAASVADAVFDIVSGGGSTVVWRFPSVTLDPGESIVIEFTAQVASVIVAPYTIRNVLYGTSEAELNYSSDNPTGASFTAPDNTNVTYGAEFDNLNTYLGRNHGRYAKTSAVETPIKLTGFVHSLLSIQTTGSWNSTNVAEKVYPGETISYLMQIQNSYDGALKDIVINQPMPTAAWTLGLLKLVSFNSSSVIVSDGMGNALIPGTDYDLVLYDSGGNALGSGPYTLDSIARFEITMKTDLAAGELLQVTFDLEVPDYDGIATVALLNDNLGAILSSHFSYEFKYASDPIGTIQPGSSNIVNAEFCARGQLSGIVFADADYDGIFGATEVGIPGIEVRLYRLGNPDTLVATTTSLGDGSYIFSDVELGHDYRVEFFDPDAARQFYSPGFGYHTAFSTSYTSHVINITDVGTGHIGDTGDVNLVANVINNNAALVRVINAGIQVLPRVIYDSGVPSSDPYPVSNSSMPDPLTESVRTGTTYDISSTVPQRLGYFFVGWKTTDLINDPTTFTGGSNGENFEMPGHDVTLVAQWEAWKDTSVYFGAVVLNGTTGVVTAYEKILAANWITDYLEAVNPFWPIAGTTAALTVPGYTFKGWYTAAEATNLVNGDPATAMHTNTALGAQNPPSYPGGMWDSAITYYYAYFEEDAAVTINYLPVVFGEVASNVGNKWLTVDDETVRPHTGTASGSQAQTVPGYTFIGWYDSAAIATASRLSTNPGYTPSRNLSNGLYEPATYYAHFIADTGALSITGTTQTYDGNAYGVTVSGMQPPASGTVDTVRYYLNYNMATNTGTLVNNNFVNAGSYLVTAEVYRDGSLIWVGSATVLINPRPLTITTPTLTKVYDGLPLTGAGAISGFVAGETYTFLTTGSQTLVGSSTNTYALVWNGTARAGNYTLVSVTLGTLTVTAAAVVVPPTEPEPEPEPTPDEIIPDDDVPITEPPIVDTITDDDVPLGLSAWALLNLILTVIGVLGALVSVVWYFRRRREEEDDDEAEERRTRIAQAQAYGDYDYQEEPENSKKRLIGRIIAVVGFIIAIILFILTENMRLPMILVDRWTIWHAIIMLIQVVCWIVASRRKDLDEEDSEEEMEAARQSLSI